MEEALYNEEKRVYHGHPSQCFMEVFVDEFV